MNIGVVSETVQTGKPHSVRKIKFRLDPAGLRALLLGQAAQRYFEATSYF